MNTITNPAPSPEKAPKLGQVSSALIGMFKKLQCNRGVVAIEFVFTFTLLMGLIFFGNESFRLTQVADRSAQLAQNYAQTVAQRYVSSVNQADLRNITQSGVVVLQPFISTLDNDVCEKISVEPSETNRLYCSIHFLAADETNCSSSKWRIIWNFGAGNGAQCRNECLDSITVGARTILDKNSVANLSSANRTAVLAAVYFHSPGPFSQAGVLQLNQLKNFASASISVITDTTSSTSAYKSGTIDLMNAGGTSLACLSAIP